MKRITQTTNVSLTNQKTNIFIFINFYKLCSRTVIKETVSEVVVS